MKSEMFPKILLLKVIATKENKINTNIVPNIIYPISIKTGQWNTISWTN
jgi:hypothetical protein